MSDDDEQRSNSYDDAIEGTLIDAAALSNVKTATMSGYQTGYQSGAHFSGALAEQETEIDGTNPKTVENEIAAIQRTQGEIDARETIAALRRALTGGDVDASSLLSSGRGVGSYGSCVCSRSERVRSCYDKLKHFLKSPKCPALSGLISFTSICIAVIVYLSVIHGIEVQIKTSLILVPNDTLWENPTGQAFLRVYYFNITNLMKVFRGDELPKVDEIGPYVYRIKENRTGLNWIYKNTSVCYTDRFYYQLDEALSVGSDNDEVVTVNVDFLDNVNVDIHLANETAFGKHTIQSLMSNVVKRFSIQQLEKDLKVHTTTTESFFDPSGDDSPHAFHRKLNGSEKFVLCTNSGVFNFSEYYDIYSWNNLKKLNFWTTDEANRIYGSDGTSFAPFVTKSTRPVVFDPRMYRTFHLEFKEETTCDGIPVYRFIIPDSEFSNGTDLKYYNDTIDRHGHNTTPTPRNKPNGKPVDTGESPAEKYKHMSNKTGNGYCTSDCVPSGIYSIRTIRVGDPLFYSLPHFLGADPFYRNLLHGVKPDESKHRPIFDVHQLTGKVIRQLRRHQMVFYMDLIDVEHFIPMFWLEYDIRASQEVIDEIEKFRLKYTAMHFLSYFLLAVSGVCFLHVMIAVVKKCIDSHCQGRYVTIQPKAPCCCNCCTPFYRRFTYFMFRIGADD